VKVGGGTEYPLEPRGVLGTFARIPRREPRRDGPPDPFGR
jgi:hypothetical protein